ncbi:MAG: RES family NAD+ phosphorylase [Cyanobacteria bacterium J06641_5]
MVSVASPPPSFPVSPQFFILPTGSELIRIYNPASQYKTQALTFRTYGPICRFDHQRPPRNNDPGRGIYYAAQSFSCCVVEYFQARVIEFGELQVAIASLTRELKLLDLQGEGAMKAGCNVATVTAVDTVLTQDWSRYFYETYPEIDGLIYGSAHNAEPAIALYERGQAGLQCDETIALAHPDLRPLLREIAEKNNLFLQN